MEKYSTGRIIFTVCSVLVAVAALVLGIVFAVSGTPLFTPMFVIFGVTLLYGVLYVIAHRKNRQALCDVAVSFELIALWIVFIVLSPLTLILYIAESISEAQSHKRANKELNSTNE